MTTHAHMSPVRALATLALALATTLSLAAPAAADPCHAYHGMPKGHADCCGHQAYPQGMGGSCPHMKGMAAAPAMGGKSLGVYVSDLTDAMLDASTLGYGVNVERVRPDSPAAAAGVRAGDLITEFAGKPVLSGDRLRWLVRLAEPDKPLDLKLMREGKPVGASVTLTAPAPKTKCDNPEAPRLGT